MPVQALTEWRYLEVHLRMRGADGKLVSPALFIPAAERNGMMAMVDRQVIRNTLSTSITLGTAQAQIRLAINLSAQSLSNASVWTFVSE